MIDSQSNPDRGAPEEVLRFGAFVLDLQARMLRRGGEEVRLQPRVFDLLVALVARPGEVVTKDELAADVWRGRVVGDAALSRAVMELRRALEDPASEPAYIETVPRVGVRFIATVRREARDDLAGAPIAPTTATVPDAAQPPDPSRRRASFAIAGGLAALAALGVYLSRRGAPAIVIGVFPIEAADSDAAGFAPVLSELLWGTVATIDDVTARRVSDPGAAMADLARASRELGFSRALTARLRQDGSRLALASRLLDSEGRVHWSHETASTESPRELPIALARALASALNRAAPREVALDASHRAALEAARQYALGREHLRARRADLAQSAFEAALAKLNGHGPSHAGLALALALRAGGVDRPDVTLERAESHVVQALKLDSELALALLAGGLIAMRRETQPLEATEAQLTRAIERDPALTDGYVWRATVRADLGLIRESVADLEAAVAQDPTNPTATGNLAGSYLPLGRAQEAKLLLHRARATLADPRRLDYPLYVIATVSGRLAEAVEIMLPYLATAPILPLSWSMLASALARLDAGEAARAAIARLANLANTSVVPRAAGACILLGDAALLDALLAQPIATSTALDERERRELTEMQGIAHAMARRWPQAVAALAPQFAGRAELFGRGGDFFAVGSSAQWFAKALLESGQHERARALLDGVAAHLGVRAAHGVKDYTPDTWLAARNAALRGEVEEGCVLLRRAVEAGAADGVTLRHDSRWDTLRADPRFEALEARALAHAHRERERVADRALRAIRAAVQQG